MSENKAFPAKNDKVDRFGVVASSICAIHCAICALLPAALAAVGLGVLLNHMAEWVFTLIAVSFGLGALVLSWRQNRSVTVAAFLSLGIVGLLASRGLEMGSDHHDHDGHHGEAHHEEDAKVKTEHHDEHHSTTEKHTSHHGDSHETEKGHKGENHHGDTHENGHKEGEEGHSDSMHAVGASVGVLSGFILLIGHLLNIRTRRQKHITSS